MIYHADMIFKNRLREARKACIPKVTQELIARRLGVTPQAVSGWERGETMPEPEKLPILAEMIGVTVDWLLGNDGVGSPAPASIEMPPHPPGVRPADVPLPERQSMPANVPVLGNASGGEKSDFFLNGEIVDYVRRPPGIAHQAGVFALYVIGDSMAPKFEEGALIYAGSTKPAKIGDYVVVELHNGGKDMGTAGFVKRLERRTASKIFCRQFNPDKLLEFDLAKVKAVYRIIPFEELMGM